MEFEKVTVKETETLVYGMDNVCCLLFKAGQRWYTIGKPRGAQRFYTLERDNVRVQVTEEDYKRLFAPSMRKCKWG